MNLSAIYVIGAQCNSINNRVNSESFSSDYYTALTSSYIITK